MSSQNIIISQTRTDKGTACVRLMHKVLFTDNITDPVTRSKGANRAKFCFILKIQPKKRLPWPLRFQYCKKKSILWFVITFTNNTTDLI